MARIKPGAANTRDYRKIIQEGDAEEYGYSRGKDNFEDAIASMKEQGINRIDPKYATPSTATGADEPPPTFNEKDWNLKTG